MFVRNDHPRLFEDQVSFVESFYIEICLKLRHLILGTSKERFSGNVPVTCDKCPWRSATKEQICKTTNEKHLWFGHFIIPIDVPSLLKYLDWKKKRKTPIVMSRVIFNLRLNFDISLSFSHLFRYVEFLLKKYFTIRGNF